MASIYSVSQINTYIRRLFSEDFLLTRITVCGEISNCKYHSSGHIYFTLKDEKGTLAAVMFAGKRQGLSFRLQDGQKVCVSGSIQIYEAAGKYQLYAEKILLDGVGDLHAAYEERKKRLQEMGMFAPEYKKPIPRYVRTVGIVTAPTGAAIRDIISIAARRNPYVQLYLCPAQVQGEGAAESIAAAICFLDELGLDCLIVGRGGGSLEDLWAFNEELVAEAIFNCTTPVISAVGHETDFTIADFVADLRAPTPSAAAELAVYEITSLYRELQEARERLLQDMNGQLWELRTLLEKEALRLRVFRPENRLQSCRHELADCELALHHGIQKQLEEKKHELALLAQRLEQKSPLAHFRDGYAYTCRENGTGVHSAASLCAGDQLQIHYADGAVCAEILS